MIVEECSASLTEGCPGCFAGGHETLCELCWTLLPPELQRRLTVENWDSESLGDALRYLRGQTVTDPAVIPPGVSSTAPGLYPQTTVHRDFDSSEAITLPERTLWDPDDDGSIELVVQEGRSRLTVRREFPKGSINREQVIEELAQLASAYDLE